MFGVILKVTNSSIQKGITFCHSIYVNKVILLLAFIFEQPSYSTKILKGQVYVISTELNFNLPHKEIK